MVLPWRRRRVSSNRGNKKELLGDISDMEIPIPSHFRCPISLDLMKDPVILSTGMTYDRESIEKWIESGNQTCPVTNQVLNSFDQIPNHAIRRTIQDWCVQNGSYGIERIPTPRIPVTSYDVTDTCTKIVTQSQRGNYKKCEELVTKIKNWSKESERNKKIISDNGVGLVLSATFDVFANVSTEKHDGLLEDILSLLTWTFPAGVEGQSKLGTTSSLRCMVGFLNDGDLSTRRNTVLVLKNLISSDQKHVKSLSEVEEVYQSLTKLIKNPICPSATKASLAAIYHMISPSPMGEKIVVKFLETGLVSVIIDTMVDAEKSICEKGFAVLDRILSYKQGREEAYRNALVMPLLVKKILRVSDLTTESAVSVLWKLCKNNEVVEGSVAVEALQAGAFQKLLVLLQVGCGDIMKEKVTDLLKLLNHYKGKMDQNCVVVSSMDFKYLKRPF